MREPREADAGKARKRLVGIAAIGLRRRRS